MFYLTMHSTHFIYGYMASDIWVKDHSESERGYPLPPNVLLFPINSKGYFICTIPHTGLHIPRPLVHHICGRKEMFYLTTHSTHFIYVYMASDIW